MASDTLKFSIHDLLLGTEFVDKESLTKLRSTYTFAEEESTSAVVECENSDEYLWIYARSGRSFPYSSEVLNIKTKECEPNPRGKNQPELRTQSFYLYNYKSQLLYLYGGIEILKRILKETNPQITVRNRYKTREEIVDSLMRVSKIRMVACNDIWTWNSNLFQAPLNVLGLGSPEQLKIEYKFGRASVTQKFKAYVREKLFQGCDAGSLKSLVVVGDYMEGDEILESTFNLRNLESSLVISGSKDESGMYDADAIKAALLSKI